MQIKKETRLRIQSEPARLDLINITVGYLGRPVLKNLSLQVAQGTSVAVVGPNGAGKSTLFKALVGLIPLQSGNILIHCTPSGRHLDCIAYIPQREEVDWHFPVTVMDVVLMGRYGRLGWIKKPQKSDYDIVHRSLSQMGIAQLANNSIANLSGGQQQRVFLARALAQEPHILLMDEPFTGVDKATQEVILALLDELHQQRVTVMVSTHDLNMAAQHFDQILLLNRDLIAYGVPAEVFTPENIRQAFGGQMLWIENGAVVVDQCCPPDDNLKEKSE